MSRVDAAEYEQMRDTLLSSLEKRGYTLSELEKIYKDCSDSYGYISAEPLKEYVKEGENG